MKEHGFGVVVVGAGHAGCEAALAAARMGVNVCVVTLDHRTVAQMPCNPAVGGVGKGHLVAEIDAVGGLQGWATDRAGLQFKMLNGSRGPAVWGPRAQCDKGRYTQLMSRLLRRHPGVELVEDEVIGLLAGDRGIEGVRLASGRRIGGEAVVLTTGTFLGGLLHTGSERRPGGRFGERPSLDLGADLGSLGLELRRFKTGTPPRLARESIDFGRLEVQLGDQQPRPFSWRTRAVANRCVCWVTRTNDEVARIITDNLERSPLFSGQIEGVGPRYCPSIEDKVVRFPHHREHTLFLEPEGLASRSIYVNGLSTSLPADVQRRVVACLPGLERAAFLRYGYAVEYDVVAPMQVERSLVCREVPGLFIAGQLLGTSGYEEAAALGLMAGINAVRRLRGERPWIPARSDAYMGVLIDDLCSADHHEPYRMFTSRAEHRLLLGVDSARERLMATGRDLGLVPEVAFHVEHRRWQRRRRAREALTASWLRPDRATREAVRRIAGIDINSPTTWAGVLRRHDVPAERVAGQLPALAELEPEDRRIVVGTLKYDGYLARHRREAERLRRLGNLEIPADLDLARVPGLSREVVESLVRHRPTTIAEAERLAGVTPAAVAILVARIGGRRSVSREPEPSR